MSCFALGPSHTVEGLRPGVPSEVIKSDPPRLTLTSASLPGGLP